MVLCSGEQRKKGQPKMPKTAKITQLPKPTEFKCNICHTKVSRAASLREHMKIHGEKLFQCNKCPKKFHRKSDVNIHENVHTQPLKCDLCGFGCDLTLERHMRIENSINVKKTSKQQYKKREIEYDMKIEVGCF